MEKLAKEVKTLNGDTIYQSELRAVRDLEDVARRVLDKALDTKK